MAIKTGLNPYGLTYYLGMQGAGTPRANPSPAGLDGFLALGEELGARVLEIWQGWLTPLDATSKEIDAAEDAPPDSDDAVALCEQGCSSGTCDAQGVCVIDCSAQGACSEQDVVCPTNLPCRVVCGDHACAKRVQCAMATSCDVQCIGPSSCGDVVQCGMGACDVRCLGDSSCGKHTDCGMSCACDVTCSGTGACHDASMCPHGMTCLLGRGCTSALPGCNTCS